MPEPIGSVGTRDPISEAHPGLHWYFGRYVYPAGGTSGVAQGKISEAEFLLPFLEKARNAIQYCRDAHTAQNLLTETPEGALFEPGLLSLILSTLTGEHDAQGIA